MQRIIQMHDGGPPLIPSCAEGVERSAILASKLDEERRIAQERYLEAWNGYCEYIGWTWMKLFGDLRGEGKKKKMHDGIRMSYKI
jgi:hypothetical protein